jgi:hypothetical protein
MEPADLEQVVDRALRGLPPPRAPRTLLPRVLAAVDVSTRPWYARGWLTWPAGWQAASLVVLIAIVAGAAIGVSDARSAAAQSTWVSDARADIAAGTAQVGAVATTVRVIWRALIAPVIPYAFGLALLMWVTCAGFGLALNHLVHGKALR